MQPLSGVFCAFWTATDRAGEILWTELDRHLKWVLASGVQGIMALGSTGEFPHLSLAQRKALVEKITEVCGGNHPVITNVSDTSLRRAVDLARHAKTLGSAAAAVLPPWFFPMQPGDLTEFFVRVGSESGMPLLLYNYPEVTGKKIGIETIRAVAERTQVIGIKQSGAEFSYHEELLAVAKDFGFPVLTGADTRFEEALTLGCAGAITGMANAIPASLVSIYQRHRSGESSPSELQFVQEVARRLEPLLFPLNVKAAIEARGFETGEPKNPVSDETSALYQRARADLANFFGNSETA